MRRDNEGNPGISRVRERTNSTSGRLRDLWRRQSTKARWGIRALVIVILALGVFLLVRAITAGKDTTWDRLQSTGVWRVGLDPSFPPFEQLDGETGRHVGFDVDLAKAIASHWGAEVEIVGVGFDELIDAVAAKRVDAAVSALPIIAERTREVAFSSPYVEAGLVLAAQPGSGVQTVADLDGRRVAAEWGSTGDAALRTIERESPNGVTLVLRESVDEALQAVLAGEADAAVVDAVSLALFDPDGTQIRPVGDPIESDPYVIVLPVDAPKLQGAVNEALAELDSDGTLSALKAKWFGASMR